MGRKPTRASSSSERARPVKITISLDPQTVRTLRAYSGFHGLKPRDVVLRAIAQELGRFVVYERSEGARADGDPPALPTPEVLDGSQRLGLVAG